MEATPSVCKKTLRKPPSFRQENKAKTTQRCLEVSGEKEETVGTPSFHQVQPLLCFLQPSCTETFAELQIPSTPPDNRRKGLWGGWGMG